MSTKTDCFGYSARSKDCVALDELYCARAETCPFYKARQEADEARRKSYVRRMKLGMEPTIDDDDFLPRRKKIGRGVAR